MSGHHHPILVFLGTFAVLAALLLVLDRSGNAFLHALIIVCWFVLPGLCAFRAGKAWRRRGASAAGRILPAAGLAALMVLVLALSALVLFAAYVMWQVANPASDDPGGTKAGQMVWALSPPFLLVYAGYGLIAFFVCWIGLILGHRQTRSGEAGPG